MPHATVRVYGSLIEKVVYVAVFICRSRKQLKNNIKNLREKKGWSQRDLANKCGVSNTTVSYIESGERVPLLTTAHIIAAVLGVDVLTVFPEISEVKNGHEK